MVYDLSSVSCELFFADLCHALAVFKEAEADAERASKDVAKAKKIEHAAHVWASIAEAKLEDTMEIMEAKRKAINKLKSSL